MTEYAGLRRCARTEIHGNGFGPAGAGNIRMAVRRAARQRNKAHTFLWHRALNPYAISILRENEKIAFCCGFWEAESVIIRSAPGWGQKAGFAFGGEWEPCG